MSDVFWLIWLFSRLCSRFDVLVSMDEWNNMLDILFELFQLVFHGSSFFMPELNFFLLCSVLTTSPTRRSCRCWQYFLVTLGSLTSILVILHRWIHWWEENVIDIVIETLLLFLQGPFFCSGRWPLQSLRLFLFRWFLPVRFDRCFDVLRIFCRLLWTFECLHRLVILVFQ